MQTPESHNNQNWAGRLKTVRVQCDVFTYSPGVAMVINVVTLPGFSLKQNCEIVSEMPDVK